MRSIVAVLLICIAVPASASASRLELRPGAAGGENELAYTAGADEVNNVALHRSAGLPGGSVWNLQDIEGPVTERVPPCEKYTQGGGLGEVSICPDDHVTSIVLDLGDRDDFAPVDDVTLIYVPVKIHAGEGRDRITMHSDAGNLLDGGPGNDVISSEGWPGWNPLWAGGADTVTGGEGDDEIHTRDGRADVVSCGPGADRVFGDDLDSVAADCELAGRGGYSPPVHDNWVRADGRPVGVTIDGGAAFTNDPDVTLTILGPPSADHIRISNDGGFGTWLTSPVAENETYPFRLASSGPDRLPKTVYVRFDGPLDQSRTFTDDIVLDETNPRVLSARVIGRARRACATGRRGCVKVALRARDRVSGVANAQFARVRMRPGRVVRFHKRLKVARTPRWVRVRDRAHNLSPWRRVAH
jgi:hypothetical protein